MVNYNQLLPDYFGDGMRAFDQGRQRKQASNLEALASKYYAGGQQADPQMLSQIAANGGNAAAFQKNTRELDDQQKLELGEMAYLVESAPEPMKAQMYRELAPKFIQRGIPMDPEYSPKLTPLLQRAAALWTHGRSGQSDLPADARSALFFQQHPELLAQEQERYKNRPFYDPSTGVLVYPKGAPGQAAPAATPAPGNNDAILATANQMIAAGIPDEHVQKWIAQQPGIQPAIESPAQVGPGVVRVGPDAGEKAAQITAAQEGTKLSYLPAQEAVKADAAIRQSGEIERNKAAIGRSDKKAQSTIEQDNALAVYEAAIGGLRESLEGTPTGPIVGRLPALTSGQQVAEGGVAAIAPVLKQMFRSAGEGVFTDKDQELLIKMIPTRQDLPAARKFKLDNIDKIVRAKLRNATKATSTPQEGAAPKRLKFNPATGQLE